MNETMKTWTDAEQLKTDKNTGWKSHVPAGKYKYYKYEGDFDDFT